jgi:hypothetical protein
MRKWGAVICVAYAVILLGLLLPFGMLLAGAFGSSNAYQNFKDIYSEWVLWVPVVMLMGGQAALLFLSVDTSDRRPMPRGPVVRSAVMASMLLLILTAAALSCVGVTVFGDHLGEKLPNHPEWWIPGVLIGIWAAWGILFYLYLRGKTEISNRVMRWLLRGSVLELLIAVPSHVIVRKRDDCCAPILTSFGITAGIAIMLLSFGPAVLLLYKKRMDTLRAARERHAAAH